MLTLITALMGAVALAAVAGARRTDTAVARFLHVGSVLRMAGYRPDQTEQVMNGAGFALPPDVQAGDVRVTGIIRLPTDLTDDLDAPADVTYTGQREIITTAAFYQRYGAALGGFPGLAFQLTRGPAGLPAFAAQVKRLADSAQFELGDDNAAAGSFAQRGTSLQALALLLFGVIVALTMLVIVGQSLVRQAYAAASDFPALRALGTAPRQLAALALAPGRWSRRAGWRSRSPPPTRCRCSRRSGSRARRRSPLASRSTLRSCPAGPPCSRSC
jgi:hypothetical protein